MRKLSLFVFFVSLFAGAALAATEVETTGPTRITPPNAFAFYNSTGITIGNYLYVYHQGGAQPGEDASCNPSGDKIIAYRALITNGVPGTFERVGRISPCVYSPTSDPGHPMAPNPPASFGPGQIFQATLGGVTKYHLLADVSDAISFYNVWRAESTDGINWKWYISQAINNQQFNGVRETIRDSVDVVTHTIDIVVQPQSFIHTSSIYMLNAVLLSTSAFKNNSEWWGFFNFWSGSPQVGEMLVDWDSTGTVPTVSMVSAVSGGAYTFRTLAQNGGAGGSSELDFVPYGFRTNVNVKTLLYDPTAATYQLWGGANIGPYDAGNVSCDTTKTLKCTTPGGCRTGDGSGCPYNQTCNVFLRNTGVAGDSIQGSGSGFLWWPVNRFSFGADNRVSSLTRFLPSGWEFARMFPFRWNSPTGRRFLFSATNDDNICTQFLFGGFYKMYVVKTEVAYQ
ncbi:MAG TPA: hypothetical protein VGJ88_02600 [Thermoanaerobaculia bacterium]